MGFGKNKPVLIAMKGKQVDEAFKGFMKTPPKKFDTKLYKSSKDSMLMIKK